MKNDKTTVAAADSQESMARPIARVLAREITAAEIAQVGGAEGNMTGCQVFGVWPPQGDADRQN